MNTPSPGGEHTVKPFWPPLAAGIALGLLLAPAATQANSYLGPMVAQGSPIGSWITWEVLGIAIGALAAAFMAGRFRVQLDGARSVGTVQRLAMALAGGLLAGFGARVSAGCTSGLGLSGAATLGVAAFVFLGLFFTVGLIVSRLVRGV